MSGTTGSPADFVARLRAGLPLHWFADDAPVLGAVLGGLGATWAQLYALLQWVRGQSRIGTAEGATLDLIAGDFFGPALGRRPGQGDVPFRAAILRELLRERATRAGLAAALADLTGTPPTIFEPTRPADTGAWGLAAGYNAAGGYGSLALPFQCFVHARRPSGQGIASVEGYESLRADGLIAARAVSSRSTPGSYFDRNLVLNQAAAGVVRLDWSNGAPLLLVEGASANVVRNPRGEGAVAGTLGGGGALPANWGRYATGGLACDVVGFGYENGIPYCDIRWYGATTATAAATFFPEPSAQIAAAAGQVWTVSCFVRLVAGTLGAPIARTINAIEYNAAGNYLIGTGVALSPGAAGLATQRPSYTRTLTNAATACVGMTLAFSYPAGVAVDFTLRIGAPQIEQAAAASSVMLPPPGSPGVAARSGETITIPATLPGGYGIGAIEYASLAMVQGQVTDADIYAAAARAMPAAAIAWTAISS